MILHVENLTLQKILKLINKFSKFPYYKINLKIAVDFLYTNEKLYRN
jgi:hypothetical protein